MINRLYILLFLALLSSCNSQTKEQMSEHAYTNSLINETSPYLLQHAHNPVDWHPWNDETLAKAKRENKLILISVGYSACHWCHVMEEESFEDEEVAKLMNENFINIKVDREERPDVDQVYMNAVQLITGSGGWPLNCIALPDARPFWGTTYLPKENWMSALSQIVKIYRESPEKLEKNAENLTKGIQSSGLITLNTEPEEYTLKEANLIVDQWRKSMDFELGGPQKAPKFPMPNNYQFLLRYAVQMDNPKILKYVNTTLEKMALGGLYDQLGGGFARYAVDAKWHIPHFEKMLYDNAQLVSLYADAYLVNKNPLYKTVVKETLDFLERELMHDNGAFYASLDADSKNEQEELEEGVYYIWTKEKLAELLGEDIDLFSAYYNITKNYKWEHNSYHLYRSETNAGFAKKQKISEEVLLKKVQSWKTLLLKERANKARPRLDDKLLSGWNGLMLKGYADAYRVFGDPHYLEKAKDIGEFLNSQIRDDGRLFRNFKNGQSVINGYLEDYASVIDGFISLYQVTFDQKWLDKSLQLSNYTYQHFKDKESGFFYFTSDLDPSLIARKIEVEDNVIPSSNSIMALNLFKLGHYFGKTDFIKDAKKMLHNVKERTVQYGAGASNWAQLYLNMLGDYYEIAIVGKEAQQKRQEIQQHYIPNALLVGSTIDSDLPLLAYKYNADETTFYVCIEGTCKLPVAETKEALEQISVDLN